eukprot:46391_1
MSTNTSTLHQRRPLTQMQPPMNSNPNHTTSPSSAVLRSTEITSSTLLKSNPVHHSKVYKLKIPYIYSVAPTFLLTLIQYCFYPLLYIFNIRLKPYWVERYFILIGDYLYKFQPRRAGSMGKNDMKMKGSPVPLQTISLSHLKQKSHGTVSISTTNYDGVLEEVPTKLNCNGYFSITSSKTTYYATETQLDAQTWINVLHNARQESITSKMGHSKIPVRREVEYVNMMGKKIVDQKKRIADLIKRKEMDEVEMICLQGGSGGPDPRGYFG